jgi:hypothetical protein
MAAAVLLLPLALLLKLLVVVVVVVMVVSRLLRDGCWDRASASLMSWQQPHMAIKHLCSCKGCASMCRLSPRLLLCACEHDEPPALACNHHL